MMQSCASAAKLRGGGPILENGVKPWPASGGRHLGSSSETGDVLFARFRELVLSAFARHAARKTTPAGTSPVVTIRHSAISSFLARATIRAWIMVRSATDLSKADLHVFSKLFDDGLERGQEAEAFSGRQIGGHDDVLDFFVRHLINVDITRQPAP